jgi:ferredoxin
MGIIQSLWGWLRRPNHEARQATRRFMQVGRSAGISRWHRLHGYVYARWPYAYIGSAIAERPELKRLRPIMAPFLVSALFPQHWGRSYHGKVMPTDQATRLVQIKEPIDVTLSEQVIPFETARDMVLTDPDHIVALDCPCRVARREPCLPLDVCLIVGEPFASFILAHHPARARALSLQEAVDIIDAEADRGHVHHAFFKDAMLGRFYAICNCCSCCCGAMSAHRSGTPMLISSGYVADVDIEACQACGLCVARCPFGALTLEGRSVRVDSDACMGCGVCIRSCTQQALTLMRHPRKPEPLLVQDLLPHEMSHLLGPSHPQDNGGVA